MAVMGSMVALLLCLGISVAYSRRMAGGSPLAQEASKGQGKSCSSCAQLTDLSEFMALSYTVFPPGGFPTYSMSFTCSPHTSVPWGQEGGLVQDALGSDCGLDVSEAESAEVLSSSDRRKCRDAYATTFKRASWLGVPAAFLQQMAVCGRCTVCAAFAKVRGLWQKIKAAVRKVVEKLMAIKQYFFGYSYAPSSVREEMKDRFDAYFPVAAHESSLLEVHSDGSAYEEDHVKMVEDALWKQLAKKSQHEAERHISLLQEKLDEAEKSEEALLANSKLNVESEIVKQQQLLEKKLPGMANNKDCQEVLQASTTNTVLSLTLSVSFPNVAAAIVHAVSLNIVGALYALIPAVTISATPRQGTLHSSMDRCLEALREAREPYLDKCTHEAPLIACTARTYQRLMQGALSQQWWPLMHNAAGTFGSIDLGYSYDSLMSSLKCAGKGSCLEKGLADLETEEKDEMKMSSQNASLSEDARFSELQCSFTGNRVDTEDTANNKLPVFTDKIWAASLKAHGSSVEEFTAETRPCPSMLPFVVAFCASDLQCIEESESAGTGYFGPGELTVAQKEVEKFMKPFQNSTKESVNASYFTERQNLPRDRRELDDLWRTIVGSSVQMEEDEDALEWNLLWRTANLTAELGLMATWPRIFQALSNAGNNEELGVDWVLARLYWEKVLFLSLRRLRAREVKDKQKQPKEDKSLAQVALNLQGIFETKLCSPGALGGLKEEHLRRLGVKDEVALALQELDSDEVVTGLWKNWVVVHVKLHASASKHYLQRMKRTLARRSCNCMCYDACGKQEASAVASCQALWSSGSARGLRRSRASEAAEKSVPWHPPRRFRASQVVVDRVHKPGAKSLEDAEILVFTRDAPGGCGTRVMVRPWRRDGKPLVGFPARCDLPDYFQNSESLDLKITLWTSEKRDDEPYAWQDFVDANRRSTSWGAQEATFEKFDSIFEPEEEDIHVDPEDMKFLDDLVDEMHTDDVPEDDSDSELGHEYEDVDADFLDSLLAGMDEGNATPAAT